MEERIKKELNGKKPSEVQDLLLDNCKATSISGLTDEFTQLTTLSLINVGLNSLDGLPKLPALRTIDLSDNKLTGGLEKLAQNCPRLYHLNLCANKIEVIKTLEPLKDLTELTALDLFDCSVTELPQYRKDVFTLLPQIRYLDGFDMNDEEADLSDEFEGAEDAGIGAEEGSVDDEFDSHDEEELAYLNSSKAVQDEDESEDYIDKAKMATANGEKKNGAGKEAIAAGNNNNARKRKLEDASGGAENADGEPKAKPSIPHWQKRNAAAGVEDMVLLRQLNDDAIVENLRKRLAARLIFTYIGPVLVSVNPFADVQKFGEAEMEQYQGAAQYENPPHIFALADSMFRNLMIDRERQCVIISGESGAGKTVAAKHIMSYLAHSSGGGQRVQRLKETILKTNPLLEAFGNAATMRNWNSSRFGKYVEIVFSLGGEPLGGRISSFLLEKSRVAQTARGERNFHIFYQLIEGADKEMNKTFGLAKATNYNYLNCSDCYEAENTDDGRSFIETKDAMSAIGLVENLQRQCLSVVAATLHIGNINFVESNGDGYATIDDEQCFFENLTRRQLQSKWGANTEQIEVRHNKEQAAYTRNAWAKALYSKLFEFLVTSVNKALNVDARRHSLDLSIGVLDIYGFEVFEWNGFEQFCINFVNEKLQQIFIELTLKAEQEEYMAEGIQWTPVEFFNNKIVCDLIEAKRPPGIMPILDDVCTQIHGQSDGVDILMLNKLTKQLLGHEHFRPGSDAFLVRHYAGEVLYQVDGFCDRNRDILHSDLVHLMLGSKNPFMRQLFEGCIPSDPNKKPTSASSKIRSQANHLMESLMCCVPHYVRCIKPNERKRALDFDEERVLHQVRYLGLRENIRVRRAGFAYRRLFERFIWRYSIICKGSENRLKNNDPRHDCEIICETTQISPEEFRLGNTKIFIRSPESLFLLEEARERHYIGLDQHPGLQAIVGGRRERIFFAASVTKYDRRFRPTRTDLLLTGKAIFLVGREALKEGTNAGKMVESLKRKIPFSSLNAVLVSSFQDDFLLLVVTSEYSSLLETPLKTEFLAALNKRLKENFRLPSLPLQITDKFIIQLKQLRPSMLPNAFPKAAVSLFTGGNERIETQQGRRTILVPNGKILNILVVDGLSADSKPTGNYKISSNGISNQINNLNKQHLNSNNNNNNSNISNQQRTQKAAAPPPLKPKPMVKPITSNPILRAIYPYEAQDIDELSFTKDQLIELIEKDESGWWKGRMLQGGKTGLLPANYVEEIKL
uniref:Myosin motor domain-containing protein n=1 Tax=Meloidogyne hapla TaxID=6305 RepID=A0A1I8BWU4_MELHA